MKNKRLIIILIILLVTITLIFSRIGPPSLPFACDYENNAWGYEKRTCDCIGIKVDTTPQGAMDAGVSKGCVGFPINRESFCKQDGDCKRILGTCNCDYKNKNECESNGGEWHIFYVYTCMALSCPPAHEPCCECPVKCIDDRCEII